MNNPKLIQLIGLTLMVVILSTACGTSQPVPTPVPPTATATQTPAEMNPFARYISLAYDAESDRFIMFGGQSGHYELETSFHAETWAYDVTANKWTQMKPASAPSKRSDYGLAYDSISDRVGLTQN